jgi:hypothetical protein
LHPLFEKTVSLQPQIASFLSQIFLESVAEKIWREWVKGCIFALRFWKSVSSLSIWLSGNKEGVRLKNSFEKRKINLAGMQKPFTFALPIEGKGLKKRVLWIAKMIGAARGFLEKPGGL